MLLAATPNWTVQVDPLTTALGYTHVQIERKLSPDWSVYAGPHLRLHDNPAAKDDDKTDLRGYGLEAGIRRYFSGKAPEGSWALVRGVGAGLSLDGETGFGGYGSVLGGYTWIFDSGLVLSAGAGVQYLHYQLNDEGPKGVLPAAHTTIGWAF